MTARKSPRKKKVRMTIKIDETTRDLLDGFIDEELEGYVSRSEVIDSILESVLEDEDLIELIFPTLTEDDYEEIARELEEEREADEEYEE